MEMDEETEAALAACTGAEAFAHEAAERGIALTPEQRAAAARPDPAGALFFMPFAANTKAWPPRLRDAKPGTALALRQTPLFSLTTNACQ